MYPGGSHARRQRPMTQPVDKDAARQPGSNDRRSLDVRHARSVALSRSSARVKSRSNQRKCAVHLGFYSTYLGTYIRTCTRINTRGSKGTIRSRVYRLRDSEPARVPDSGPIAFTIQNIYVYVLQS